jgi:hypothetical protein
MTSRLALGIAVAAAALTASLHLLDVWIFNLRLDALNADANWSISDTASFVAIAATLAAVLVIAARGGPGVTAALALVPILAFIVLDDGMQLHERFGELWQVVYLPVLGPAFVLLWWSSRHERDAARLTRLGLVVLAISLFMGHVFETFVSADYWDRGDWAYESKVAVKQGLELAGWVLVAAGIGAVARTKVNEVLRRKTYAKHDI